MSSVTMPNKKRRKIVSMRFQRSRTKHFKSVKPKQRNSAGSGPSTSFPSTMDLETSAVGQYSDTSTFSSISTNSEDSYKSLYTSLWQNKFFKPEHLPAIVVAGDQSTGKSSLLHSISGLQFPSSKEQCTRFATRVQMHYGDMVCLNAHIEPAPDRDETSATRLQDWSLTKHSLHDFAQIVEQAGEVIGTMMSKGFFRDSLVIDVAGPKLPFFTFVDLPGIVHSRNAGQTARDLKIVRDLVEDHMRPSNMIILAIIAADRDFEGQHVLEIASEEDREGNRTLGVFTKVDLCTDDKRRLKVIAALNDEGEQAYKLGLGYHIVRNRKSDESEYESTEQVALERQELNMPPWNELPSDKCGTAALINRLERLTSDFFHDKASQIKEDVINEIQKTEEELQLLGPATNDHTSSKTRLQEQLQVIADLTTTELKEDQEFMLALETLAGDFEDLVRSNGHHYTFDEKTLPPGQRRDTVGGSEAESKKKWQVKEPLSVQTLLQDALEIVSSSPQSLPTQLSDKMVTTLLEKQTKPWANLKKQYAQSVAELVEASFRRLYETKYPNVSQDDCMSLVNDLSKGLVMSLREDNTTTEGQSRERVKEKAEAMRRGWLANWNDRLQKLLAVAYGVKLDGEGDLLQETTTKKDYKDIYNTLTRQGLGLDGFTARQLVARTQLTYQKELEQMIAERKEPQVLEKISKYLGDWPATFASGQGIDILSPERGITEAEENEIKSKLQKLRQLKDCEIGFERVGI